MEYKYLKEQIKGAKELVDKYPNIQTHKDIYNEFVEVLKKAQAFDEILNIYQTGIEECAVEEELHYDMCHVLDDYIQDTEEDK